MPASGSTFPLGTTPVALTATDAHGNTGQAFFTVTVRDTTPPQLSLPPDQFFRIHYLYLVKLERVEELLFLGNHRYAVRLSDNRVLPVGRSRYPALRQRLGLDRVMNLEGRVPLGEPEEALSQRGDGSTGNRRRPLPVPDATGYSSAEPLPAERL